MKLRSGAGAWSEWVELGGRIADALEGQVPAARQRQVLKTLQVVVEEMTAAVDEGALGLIDAARGQFGFAGPDHGALGDEHLVSPLAGKIGAAQLQAQLGRAAGQNEDRGAGVAVQRFAASLAAGGEESQG